MADDFGERTEPPTPRRRQEARERGQIARSADLPAAVVLLAGIIAVDKFGPAIWGMLLRVMHAGLAADGPMAAGDLVGFSGMVAGAVLRSLWPLFVVLFLAALVTVYWEVGLLLTLTPVTPGLGKLNPLQGIKRMFSMRTTVTTLLGLGKVVLLMVVAWWTISGELGHILYALEMDHLRVYEMAAALLIRVALRLAAVMLFLALCDYVYQRYRHEKDLRMSKEEIKEELRRMEGDPIMKRRRREVQIKLAHQRIRREVPRADVIVTNPTHVAVALRYDPEHMNAPRVVAKGADWLALRIRQIAAAHSVPIVERPPLARMLYEAVDVGQEIPERFYQAVAEILAYVYELTGRRAGPQPVPVG